MIDLFSIQNISIVLTIIATICGFSTFTWKKLIKPTIIFVKSQHGILSSIETIKHEVVTNGGGSLKDAVIALQQTCSRIEKTQKVIEQRSKSSLHYHTQALFETDKSGALIWTNERFFELTGKTLSDIEGFNWISYVNEYDREEFITEFSSCMKMCRKFEYKTEFTDKKYKFVGYPYKINESEHHGFLFHLSLIKE